MIFAFLAFIGAASLLLLAALGLRYWWLRYQEAKRYTRKAIRWSR